jgi:hypothetical protein
VRKRLLRRLEDVERARADLERELARLAEALEFNRRLLEGGGTVAKMLADGPGPEARRRVREAWSRLNLVLHEYRAETIRSLVDEEGWTLTSAAKLTGNARQLVSRLYHHVRSRPGTLDTHAQ